MALGLSLASNSHGQAHFSPTYWRQHHDDIKATSHAGRAIIITSLFFHFLPVHRQSISPRRLAAADGAMMRRYRAAMPKDSRLFRVAACYLR